MNDIFSNKVGIMMRATFGFFVIVILIGGFSVFLLGTIHELNNSVTISEILDRSINIDAINLEQTSLLIDSNGQLISEIYEAENRVSLPYSTIPQPVIDAFIATEDQHFFSHKGFDIFGITRAFLVNVQSESIEQGGSTITQQLVRNLYLNNEKSYNRKLKEILFAYQLEKELTKEKIIELYINSVYFQNNTYGIEAAAQFYFSKSAAELSLAETAFLCAIPNNPSYYNPLQHFEHTKTRQKLILRRMLEAKFISQTEFEAAINENITLVIKKKVEHFPSAITYIYEELKQLIAEQDGYNQKLSSPSTSIEEKVLLENELNLALDQLLKSGVIIETALDPVIQTTAEQVLQKKLGNSSVEGAIVVLDHQTHEMKAIVGGKQYAKHDFHRAFQGYRQPGSAIKPLLVYGPYLAEFGASARTTIDAGPFCKNGYCPRNASGSRYGTVSLETALKYSYNTAAVRLLDQLGINNAFSYIETFQFSKLVPEDYRLPAGIGGFTYGVTPLELTNAYTTFANNGQYKPSYMIRNVLDKKGNVLYTWNHATMKAVWDAETNNKMRNLLNKVMTEGTGRKAYYSTSSTLGGKTGTTNDYKDLWFVGFNHRYTTGVWLGMDKPTSLHNFSQTAPHLTVWKNVMMKISP